MAWYEWALAVVGFVGLAGWIELLRRVGSDRRLRSVTGFGMDTTVDVVVSTSSGDRGNDDGLPGLGYDRLLVTTRTLEAMLAISKMRNLHRGGGQFRVAASSEAAGPWDHDLVLVGGERKNAVSRELLRLANSRWPNTAITREVSDSEFVVRVGSRVETVSAKLVNGHPAQDILVIVCCQNLLNAGNKGRAILCAGFTSSGTLAAVNLLTRWVAHGRLPDAVQIVAPRWRSRRPQDFVAVCTVALNSGGVVSESDPWMAKLSEVDGLVPNS